MFPRSPVLRSILVLTLATAASALAAVPHYRFSRIIDFTSEVTGVARDAAGNVIVIGNGSNGPSSFTFIEKLDPTGTTVLYRTAIANSPSILVKAARVTVDAAGNAYVVGVANQLATFSTAVQPAPLGAADAFIMKFSPTGTPLFARFIGGSADDYGTAITLDHQGNIIIGGTTDSTNFPVVNAAQAAKSGATTEAFVMKLTNDGQTILFSTYYGGSNAYPFPGLFPPKANETLNGIAVDANDNIYITGGSHAFDLPLRNASRTAPVFEDAYAARFTRPAASSSRRSSAAARMTRGTASPSTPRATS